MKELELDLAATERTLVAFLRDRLEEAGRSKAVVGLSGGIDSAVVCFLAARALGPENVTVVMMPARTSSPESLTDARLVVEATGVHSRTVAIGDMADGYLKHAPDASPLRKGNVYARCRMIVLYDVSAEVDGLVVGTSNRTELLLGYGTLFGDLACAINPIAELYKTQVRALAAHLGVPESIRRKAPSADLWEGQRDEDELGGSYEEFDRLLWEWVEREVPPAGLLEKGFAPELVQNVAARFAANRFKGRGTVMAELAVRTIGPDYELPQDPVA